jgi:Bifunctional DNA primase/polymerase, N-terminal
VQPREAVALARTWATRGVPAFPVALSYDPDKYAGRGGIDKRPAAVHGHHDATTDRAALEALFDAATRWLRTGDELAVGLHPGPAGLVVLDVDCKSGVDGYATVERLDLPSTFTPSTPSGGQHRFYAKPGAGYVPNVSPWPGVDVRADAGWVVAPGVTSPWGGWDCFDDWADVSLLPAELWAELVVADTHTATGRWEEWDPAAVDPATAAAVEVLVARFGAHDPYVRGRVAYVCRPGKRAGSSATVGYVAPGVVRVFTSAWPGLAEGTYDLDELDAGAGNVRDLIGSRPVDAVAGCVDVYRRWLHLDDDGHVLFTLGTLAANLLEGDPVWGLLVGAPGCGKTETVAPLAGLPYVHEAAVLTEAALLSGSSTRDSERGATGGLLRQVDRFGVLLCKDLGSLLSMNRDARAAAMAALREVYDGRWARPVGTAGGRVLHWAGKCGLVGAVTPSIDRHHAVMGALGERFLLYRMGTEHPDQQARRRLANRSQECTMRAELAAAVAAVAAAVDTDRAARTLEPDEERWLVGLTMFAVHARSAVERDSYHRDVEVLPSIEAPGRLVGALSQLLAGLEALGVDDGTARGIVSKVAWDVVPHMRRLVLDHLHQHGPTWQARLVDATGLPATSAERTVEDLGLLGLVQRHKEGKGERAPWLCELTDTGRNAWPDLYTRNVRGDR